MKAFLVPDWNQHSTSNLEASSGKAANRDSLALCARPPCCTTAAQGSAFFNKSTSLSGIFRGSRASKLATKPHPTFPSHLCQGIYTAGPSGLCSHDFGLVVRGTNLDTKMSCGVLHLPRTSAKFRCMVFQATFIHTIIYCTEENNHISFHMLVSANKKKSTRLIKLFHIYKIDLEAWSKSQ